MIEIIKLNNYITIYIISNKKFNKVEHIVNIVKWLSQYSKPKKLNLFIFLTPFEKLIKYKNQKLTRNEINSGACSKFNNWIQIFRSEELLKVLIHELIHFYNLDVDNTDWVNNILPIKLPCFPLILNEAITESMAIILHTYYYSEIKNEDFKLLLNKELKHSKNMYNKILYHHNIKTFQDLFNICQYTNVISYYIIKYILLEDINNALIYLFDKKNIKYFIIKKLIDFFNNDIYLVHDIKKLDYEFSAKMSVLNLL
jgi:hypothetical protein